MVRNLRGLRIKKGVSQQSLADAIGVSQQSINKYENHNVEPDIATLIRLADFFGVTVDALIGHDASSGNGENILLSTSEWKLIYDFRSLTQEEKDSIRLVLKNYLKRNP